MISIPTDQFKGIWFIISAPTKVDAPLSRLNPSLNPGGNVRWVERNKIEERYGRVEGVAVTGEIYGDIIIWTEKYVLVTNDLMIADEDFFDGFCVVPRNPAVGHGVVYDSYEVFKDGGGGQSQTYTR